jgi:hypothetical protein
MVFNATFNNISGALLMGSLPSVDLGNAMTSLILAVLQITANSLSNPVKKHITIYLKFNTS